MPTIGTSSKPAYVYDAGTDTWIPIGPGEHTHDYAASAHNHDSTYIAKTLTTTTGDLIYASSANTPARLGIGSTDQVLTVSGGVPSWATPAAGGMTLLASGSLGAGGVSLSSISGSYEELKLVVSDIDYSSGNDAKFNINSDSGSNYYGYWAVQSGAGSTQGLKNAISYVYANYNDMATTANGATIILRLPNYSNTTGYKALWVQTVMVNNSGGNETFNFWGMWKNENAINAISFGSNGGNVIDGGTYELWGIK